MTQKKVEVIPATKRSVHNGGQLKVQSNIRVAAYCRVSTGDESQQTSYTTQKAFYTNLITNKPGWRFAGIYADEAKSGTSREHREDFNRMMADALDGKLDYIVTKSISRFARNTVDTLNCVRQLRQQNPPVGVYFEKENIDTLDATGELILTILSALAQDESRSISDNIRWSIQKNFQAGKPKIDLNRMLGYDKGENGEWVINPEQAKTVRYIFERYVCGQTANRIAKELNELGRKTVNKKNWSASSVLTVLRNEKYVGDIEMQKTITKDFLTHRSIHECALEQSFMEMLYRLKRDYEKNHEASEISTLFHKACEQMYQQMKGNSVSVERLETLDAQIKELEEKLQETIGRQVTAMRDAVLEQNLELNESLAEGNITLDEIDSDIRNGLTGNDIGTSFYHADYEEGSEIEAYASLAKDIRQRIESFRKEKETLSQEQGALTVMKKNFDLFIACLKELPEQNAAGMPLKVNGLDVQGSLFRDVDGKPVDGAVASLKRGRLKITPERIAEAPDLLHFEKGIYCAFMKKGTVKGDIVLYETNFGVTLPTCGNQRTLTSFLGFKKCSLDGLVMLVDAPYRVYDNTVQYRRYLRSKAKREQAV